MTVSRRLLVCCASAFFAAASGCDSAADFDADVAGHAWGRAGGALGSVFQVIVDFQGPGGVRMDATKTVDGIVQESAFAVCDLAPQEVGLFETRLPASNCDFESSLDDELPPTPSAIVIGLRNFTVEDGETTVEIDPSLDEDLPSPFSFVDGYNTLELLDDG